jgi:hypothetical protein
MGVVGVKSAYPSTSFRYLRAAYANTPFEKCHVVKDSSALILGNFSTSSRGAIVVKGGGTPY